MMRKNQNVIEGEPEGVAHLKALTGVRIVQYH